MQVRAEIDMKDTNRSLPTVSLIITTYNWPEALELTLLSILRQEVYPNEVVIADDGSGPETTDLIKRYQSRLPIPLKHVWSKDIGFTRTLIINKAVKECAYEYLIQIDGDIILHPRFVIDHLKFARPNSFVSGSRAMLSKVRSESILKKQNTKIHFFSGGVKHRFNAFRWSFLVPFFSKKQLNIRNLRGCNMAFWKKDFYRANGYNEEIVGWGREDSELAIRFINNRIYKRKLKGGGIQFHIYHPEASRTFLKKNNQLLENAINEKLTVCNHGVFNLTEEHGQNDYNKLTIQKISSTIITYNEENDIRKCIESILNVSDEIIVVDSFSTDRTEEICMEYGVRFLKNEFKGHIQQKQFAISLAKHDFILSLDADENLSPELEGLIINEKRKLNFDNYLMNRRNFYRGKLIKYCGWYPDERIRLFNKNFAQWGGENPHDLIVPIRPKYTTLLNGDILHYTLDSIEEHKAQTERYARIAADYKYKHGLHKNTAFLKMIFNPFSKFLTMYLFRLGFLDGGYGIRICYEEFICTYRKYKYLYQLYDKNGS